jgi:hypothetical protein
MSTGNTKYGDGALQNNSTVGGNSSALFINEIYQISFILYLYFRLNLSSLKFVIISNAVSVKLVYTFLHIFKEDFQDFLREAHHYRDSAA